MTKWKSGEIEGARDERELEIASDVRLAVTEWLDSRFPDGDNVKLPDGWTNFEDLPGCEPLLVRVMIINGKVLEVDISSKRLQTETTRQ